MTDYRYMTADLVTDVDLADIPLVDASFGPSLNGGGTCTGSIPLHSTVREKHVRPNRTALYVYRDDELVWGGIIWQLQPQGQRMSLTAAGFESYAQQRLLLGRIGPFIEKDPLEIVRVIWNYLQAEVSIGVQLGTETTRGKVKVGRPASGTVGTDTYVEAEPYDIRWWELRGAGDAINELADAANGFDYRVDVSQRDDGSRRKLLRLGYPRLGRRITHSAITSGPLVRATPTETVDGTFGATHVIAMGAGEGSATLHTHHRADRASGPILDQALMWKDETRLSQLRLRGEAEIQARQVIESIPSLTIAADHPELPLGSYRPGDDLYVDVEDGWTDFAGWCRVMGWRLSPEAEEVSLDLARADLFQYGPAPDIGQGS